MLNQEYRRGRWADLFASAAAVGPVVVDTDTGVYYLTARADVLAVLRNPEVYVRAGETVRTMDPGPRRMVQRRFSPRALKDLEPDLRSRAALQIEQVAAAGECEAMSTVASPLATQLFLALFDEDEPADLVDRLMNAGLRPVTAAIGFALLDLATNPERQQALRQDRSGIARFVQELMRRQSPTPIIVRSNIQDVTVAGVTIPASSTLILRIAELDESPDGALLAFGAGAYKCVANHLTMLALQVFLGEWLERIPHFTLDAETLPTVRWDGFETLTELPLRWRGINASPIRRLDEPVAEPVPRVP